MNKTLFALFFIFSLVFLPQIALAEEESTSSDQANHEFKQEIRQKIRSIFTDIKNIRVETRQEIHTGGQKIVVTGTEDKNEFKKNRIRTTHQGLLNAFTKRIEALKHYQERIQTRLTEKKAKFPSNQKLIDAQTKLDNITKTLLPKYESDLALYKTQVDKILASTDPKSLIPALRSAAKVVEQDLKNIRQELVAALRLVVQAK